MTRIVAADIGGTHARFAIAEVETGRVVALGAPAIFRTADYSGLHSAWTAFAAQVAGPLPRAAAIALAAPIGGDALRLTNADWTIRPGEIDAELGLDHHLLVNDFEAVGHAVASVGPEHLCHLCGPEEPPREGVTTIVGPGTGLGVAMLVRFGGETRVIATEGGHIGFAPGDAADDALLARLRDRYGRVSVERVVSGAGLGAILDDAGADARDLWARALGGTDAAAVAALDRFCGMLGAVAGDLALAQGANAVIIAGGLGSRLAKRLSETEFTAKFASKNRFSAHMATICVRILTHPEPGLLGAAAAFAGYCLPIQSDT